ncbi:hypothetical protein [Candidatus Protochlamydia phocaeensis]|jgi:hypothetical protein|uniref:hypothetical protein n=1 Tax=Candidatus Protochlamydia phocaeensis TaxID=1414722 RepID=UPI0005096B27|nr:hypothetical protein [Candidatus Protochlamydia phocaeensis]
MPNFEYVSPQQIVSCGKYPFTIGQIRHYLIHRHKNGLDKVVRKIGKRILLRVDLFEAWIEAQKEAKNG